jgi:hypothetical protein
MHVVVPSTRLEDGGAWVDVSLAVKTCNFVVTGPMGNSSLGHLPAKPLRSNPVIPRPILDWAICVGRRPIVDRGSSSSRVFDAYPESKERMLAALPFSRMSFGESIVAKLSGVVENSYGWVALRNSFGGAGDGAESELKGDGHTVHILIPRELR